MARCISPPIFRSRTFVCPSPIRTASEVSPDPLVHPPREDEQDHPEQGVHDRGGRVGEIPEDFAADGFHERLLPEIRRIVYPEPRGASQDNSWRGGARSCSSAVRGGRTIPGGTRGRD